MKERNRQTNKQANKHMNGAGTVYFYLVSHKVQLFDLFAAHAMYQPGNGRRRWSLS